MSLSEVARVAGVSKSTVSRFLRGQLSLKPDTAQRIEAALEQQGLTAPAKRGAKLRRVALIVPDLVNPYFAQLSEACREVGDRAGIGLTIQLSGGVAGTEKELIGANAADNQVDGILIVPRNSHLDLAVSLCGTPLVVLDEAMTESSVGGPPTVLVDNFGGAFQATNYLLSRGHRRIAHVGGAEGLETAAARLRGYAAALENAGVRTEQELVLRGSYTEKFGANALGQLLQLAEPPTAIFAASDIIAIGIFAAADANGLQIPDDISLVGFDGIPVADWLRPALTTVAQPVRDIAALAFQEITGLHAGTKTRNHIIPMELKVRTSVKELGAG